MVKVKTSDTLSLDKSKQKKVVKQTKKLKEKIKDGKISIKRPRRELQINVEQKRGLIYVGHIPHGFYENEMKKYFKQFGAVTNVKVCRSNRTGNSKGYGYVEFSHPDVAKIAAETMNNYLMFKKRVVAEYVPHEKRPQYLFNGRKTTPKRYSAKVRREKQRVVNSKIDEKTHLKRSSARMSRLNKKLQILEKAGIDYKFAPVDVPEELKKKKEAVKEVKAEFVQDPYDSDIEIKVPVKQKKPILAFQEDPYDSDIEVKVPVKPKLETPKKIVKKVIKKETPKKISKSTISNKENKVDLESKPLGKTVKKVTKKTSKPVKTKAVISKVSSKKVLKQTSRQKLLKKKK